MSEPIVFIVVRHGERYDHVDRFGWEDICQKTGSSTMNPPLTDTGKSQAVEASIALKKRLKDVTPMIYASPASRTLTAAVIAKELECLNLSVGVGLYPYTEELHKFGTCNFTFLSSDSDEFKEVTLNVPVTEFLGSAKQTMSEAVKNIITTPTSTIPIIVAHGETIVELCDFSGRDDIRRVPFCGAYEFSYNPTDDEFFFIGKL